MSQLIELPVKEPRLKIRIRIRARISYSSESGEVCIAEILLQNIPNKYCLAMYFGKCVMQAKKVTWIKSLPLRGI